MSNLGKCHSPVSAKPTADAIYLTAISSSNLGSAELLERQGNLIQLSLLKMQRLLRFWKHCKGSLGEARRSMQQVLRWVGMEGGGELWLAKFLLGSKLRKEGGGQAHLQLCSVLATFVSLSPMQSNKEGMKPTVCKPNIVSGGVGRV
jgi:hypothetical protein